MITTMTSGRVVVAATIVALVTIGCSSPTENRNVVCAMPGISSIVVEIRDANGVPNAKGATVRIQNTRGYESTAQGFGDELTVPAGNEGRNVGGTFTVEVTKPYHQTATVSKVVVPEGPCGIEAPGRVAVTLSLLPGAPPVRQVVTPPYGYGFGYGNMTSTLPAHVEADAGVSQAVTWLSRDTTVFTISSGGALRTMCRAQYGSAWAIVRSVVDTTKRDSIVVGVFADNAPARCSRS